MAAVASAQRDEPIETLAELLDQLERHPDLVVDADLTVTVDGRSISVLGYGDLLAVDCPSLAFVGRLLWRYRDRSMDLSAGLASTGLTVELRVRGVPIVRLGEDAAPGSLAGRLGLGPVELVPEGPLLAALTRRRG